MTLDRKAYMREYSKKYYKANKEKRAQHYQQNRSQIRLQQAGYYRRKKPDICLYNRDKWVQKVTPLNKHILLTFEGASESQREVYAAYLMRVADECPIYNKAIRDYVVDSWLGAYFKFAA